MYRLISTVKSKDKAMMLDSIGGRIRFFREMRGITQGELARLAGLHKDFISNLERAMPRYRNPTSDNILSISRVLDVPPGVLLDESLRTFFKDTKLDPFWYREASEGDRVKALRTWKRLSLKDLAQKSRLSIDDLKKIEASPRLPFSARHRLAFELEVDAYWISLDGLRLTHLMPSRDPSHEDQFTQLFYQLPQTAQTLVLQSAIALMRSLLVAGTPAPKSKKPSQSRAKSDSKSLHQKKKPKLK